MIKLNNIQHLERVLLEKTKKFKYNTQRQVLYQIGRETASRGVKGSIQDEMTNGSKSGRQYLIYRGIGGRKLVKPRLHTSSTKDEMPAVISGQLRSSTGFSVEGFDTIEIGSNANHSTAMNKRNDYLKKGFDRKLSKIKSIICNHYYNYFK